MGLSSNLIVQKQVTGPDTNCYLLFDPDTLDAALIDVAGPVDGLLATVRNEQLKIRYLLFTHGHFDHVLGLPAIRDIFPDAMVCIHPLEFEDMQYQREWAIENFGEELISEWMKDPELRRVVEFDVKLFGKPDLLLKDGAYLEFGSRMIHLIHAPGHSRGGVCFAVDNLLFSGDVLFRGSVGRVDVQNSSRDDQIVSVRRLYRELPDDTVVYPGHGEATSIGAERIGNERITETMINI